MMRAILVALLSLVATLTVSAAELAVGDTPPDYLGRDTNNDKLYVSDFQGKVVIVTFWATWCGPCLTELPILNAIQEQAGTGGPSD